MKSNCLSIALAVCLGWPLSTDAAIGAWAADAPIAADVFVPLIEAVADGERGSFVVWQESSSITVEWPGLLRAQHLLPIGALDPLWPAEGAVVCSVSITRRVVGLVPDHAGGLYVWWREGLGLFLTRLDYQGRIARGWEPRGRLLGTLDPLSPQPSVIEDGAHGIYLAWAPLGAAAIAAIHLGPGNLGAGGWPDAVRSVVLVNLLVTWNLWPRLAPAPDGGFYLAWESWSADTTVAPSAIRLHRFASNGTRIPRWGLEFTPFAVDPYEYPGTRLIDLVSDDRGGVFLLRLRSSGEPELLEMLVHRRDAQGLPTGGWPAEGRVIGWQPIYYDRQPDKDIWPTVHSDGREGVVVGSSLDRRDAPSIFVLTSLSADGTRSDLVEGELDVSDALIETGTVSDPPISYMADSNPSTGFLPPWGYPRDAYVRLQHSPAALGWSAWSEWHSGGWNQWFGDIALASDGERGVVLFWSRMRDEVGLFARHFTPDDATLGREVGRPAFGLRRVRFVPERGVCAFVDLPPRASARLEVFDVSGRRVASGAVDGSGLLEAVVPGTSGLSSGMYFLKLSREGQAQRARVVVAR